MRRTLAVGLLAALAVAGVAAAAAVRHPRDPREAFTPADRAWAQRIVLQASDLPGQWRSSKPGGGEDPRCPTFDPDMSDLTITGEAESRDFDRRAVFVSSVAQVFRTARETATSFRRGAKPQLSRCSDDAFRKEVGDSIKSRLVSGRIVAAPPVGERRLALRLVWELTLAEGTARTYLDLIGWDRGRVSAAVVVLSAGRPPDAALERRIAQRMDARMRRQRPSPA